jgi:DNA invertase Pin-like site-specific DNA recombinase
VGAPFSLHSAAVNELELDPPLATGATVGYARVSTAGQLLDRQLASLTAAGCIRVFADKKSGKNIKREELWKALDFLRPGDTLVVASLDRLGRSLADLISIVAGLRRRGIGFASLRSSTLIMLRRCRREPATSKNAGGRA